MSRTRGFTLLELLVVVAIMVVLASLLLPAFSAAREKARQTKCLSNQRDIAMMIHTWVQDHEETYPDAATVWDELKVIPEQLLCPTMEAELLRGKRRDDAAPRQNDYAYSNMLSNKPAGAVKTVTEELLTVDANVSSRPQSAVAVNHGFNVFSAPEDIAYRHSDGFIASFCDGHVELLHEPPPLWVIMNPDIAEFDAEVMKTSYPVLVYFSCTKDSWVDLPNMVTGSLFDNQIMRDIPRKYRGKLKILAEHIGVEPQTLLHDRFGLNDYQPLRYPYILFFRNGHEVNRILGPDPKLNSKDEGKRIWGELTDELTKLVP